MDMKAFEQHEREAAELAKKVYIKDDRMCFNLAGEYFIDMSRCNSLDKIVYWMRQLLEKRWVTREALDRFIHLACKYHQLEIPEA